MHDASPAKLPLVVWSIHDEKPGHVNQLRGLIRALSDRIDVDVRHLATHSPVQLIRDLLRRRFRRSDNLPQPDLILGAGHATHFSLLVARRATGAKSVVLMKPTLPRRWFDLCIIPKHDLSNSAATPGRHTIVTRGVLNAVVPSGHQEANRGLLLIGGKSSHYEWSNDDIFGRVTEIVERERSITWALTTSRRTPTELTARLQQLSRDNLTCFRGEETSPDWLPAQLARASTMWVTEDSVSMVYEALTAGGAVGLLPVPRIADTRVSRGVATLLADGWVTPFDEWQRFGSLTRPPSRLSEAERCAEAIITRWFADRIPLHHSSLQKAA